MTATDTGPETSPETSEEFSNRIVAAIDGAGLAILLSVGHQTGLLDTMAELPPSTSAQIAESAGLDERYVREWLGGVTAAQVVDYDPEKATYVLPAHRAAALTRAAGPNNLARLTQFISLLGEVEQKVIGCFRAGGGVPYSDYPRFHTLMAELSGEVFEATLVDVVLPMVDGLPERLRAGAEVADFGCGSGHAVNLMAQAFPHSRFTGIDFSDAAVAAGAAEAARLGLNNAAFERHDLAHLDEVTEKAAAYDVITAFDTIHDQAHPARVLANIHRALRPGGVLLMVDIKASSRLEDNVGVPLSTYLYTTSMMHCMTVSLALDGVGLGTVWGRQVATSMLAAAGFGDVQVREIESDPLNNYYIARK
ncbi:methyltransferase [Mycobacterium kansasii]|uniref:Putative S-adenosylmethionine-dependent methyltransferase/MSMEI_2290 n=1 Tax=Mycobacterium attenuatum TaxID=2341086 RepID=A0A498Q737_9MYCO|nr:class I SAM-dependent methyltransferase [Mycobacterium attenuatum]ORB82988.1 methyltransferase [Mycobacterium kansasii]VBA40205.1 putative S-adenosylmethionine-dependent methyltransferase/MSMEI_2290 [Mycobacterium attenuatum]VBA55398.1 putative S-adenosylmethionine-dependent methyltransferase/MSMEI_2290 [Mycobacterium attenuatum]VBA59350.1 putative S-adenosylmethionine-dependent methyltransferase/MSMEI_2290 [Mycobacterium attenuatum]